MNFKVGGKAKYKKKEFLRTAPDKEFFQGKEVTIIKMPQDQEGLAVIKTLREDGSEVEFVCYLGELEPCSFFLKYSI